MQCGGISDVVWMRLVEICRDCCCAGCSKRVGLRRAGPAKIPLGGAAPAATNQPPLPIMALSTRVAGRAGADNNKTESTVMIPIQAIQFTRVAPAPSLFRPGTISKESLISPFTTCCCPATTPPRDLTNTLKNGSGPDQRASSRANLVRTDQLLQNPTESKHLAKTTTNIT
jgi:hypothetical protein